MALDLPSYQKRTGAYYTPDAIAASLVRWAAPRDADLLLDPSCGDGRFIRAHRRSVGIEQAASAAEAARGAAPDAQVHVADFFEWAARTDQRFECAAGNPPFIRYQHFTGSPRIQALLLCRALGVDFTGLASSWAPFLVVAASLLKPAGRMAFVVPAEIGHAPYAAPLLEYLARSFDAVEIVAIREKLFPELSEDCWLLYASGHGGRTLEFGLTAIDRFTPSSAPPRGAVRVPVNEWRKVWNQRVRPYLMSSAARESYVAIASSPGARRFGEFAAINIGYVTGANDFFHLRPSAAARFGIPDNVLRPTVRNGRALPGRTLTRAIVDEWRAADDPALLLQLPKNGELSDSILKYLDTDDGRAARTAYKCRTRTPWYWVPDVKTPDFFLTVMSGMSPLLVRNEAGCACTNALHTVKIRDQGGHIGPGPAETLMNAWETPLVQLSCELEGHPLGGGMLKLEPREACRIVTPADPGSPGLHDPSLQAGLRTMRSWRHYDI